MVSSKLVAASSIPLVLSLLAQGESYGYALAQKVKLLSDGRIDWNEGMLYPVLHRLEREGLVQATWRRPEGGRRRRYYRLSPRGEAAIRAERDEWEVVDRTLRAAWGQARG